jgi:hypothetical protein
MLEAQSFTLAPLLPPDFALSAIRRSKALFIISKAAIIILSTESYEQLALPVSRSEGYNLLNRLHSTKEQTRVISI